MNNWFARARLALAVVLALIVSAMMTVPAFADGEAPPVDSPPAEVVSPSEDGAGVEEAPAESAGEGDAQTIAESGEAVTLPELLEVLPENTEVIVTNAEGEAIPLATEEAASILAENDPQWCPVGAAPGSPTCSGVKTSFNGTDAGANLIQWLKDNPTNVAGVIWIRDNYDSANESGAPIDLDGSLFGTTADFALTVQGGWTGAGSTVAGNTLLTVPLWITNWNAAITINNIVIDGATVNIDEDKAALEVETSGAVTLNNVTVKNGVNNDNDKVMHGARVDNRRGIADVKVNNSVFENNDGGGLFVFSYGAIALTKVTAKDNDGHAGAVLDNCDRQDSDPLNPPDYDSCAATTPKPVTISSGSQFTGNWGNGLQVYSLGAISVTDLYVVGNNGYDGGMNGTWFDNQFGAAGVTIGGVNIVAENNGGGVEIFSSGAVKVNNLVSNANDNGSGLYVDNSTALTAQPVTVTGFIETKFNGDDGIYILSKGAITLPNVTSTDNGNYGAYLNNTAGAANVTLTTTAPNNNRFMDNGNAGLWVESNGIIAVSNLDVSGNGHATDGYWDNTDPDNPVWVPGTFDYDAPGVHLDNSGAAAPMAVNLTGKVYSSNNDGAGLEIYSKGAVNIANLTARGSNIGNGAHIYNADSTAPQNVTITGYARTDDNQNGSGLVIQTKGAVSLANLSANNNGFTGVWVDNTFNTLTATSPKPAVTLAGTSSFYNNGLSGLGIQSHGMITVNNIRAGDNGEYGVWLKNDFADGAIKTIAGVSVLNLAAYNPEYARNGYTGLQITSHGNVIVNDFDAYENGWQEDPLYGHGVYIDNSAGTGTVTVGTTRANWTNDTSRNWHSGMEILSAGAVIINKISANDNGGDNGVDAPYGFGVYVDNTYGVGKPVSINGAGSWFYNNYNDGLHIESRGIITTNNVSAGDNGNAGVYLDNSTTVVAQAVNVNNVATYDPEFARNGYSGLVVASRGNIKVMDFHAYENGWQENPNFGYGIYLTNDFAGSIGNITVGTPRANWRNEMRDNFLSGLEALSRGIVTLTNMDSWSNGKNNGVDPIYGYGVRVYNADAALPKNVLLNGVAWFENNYSGGLLVQSVGAITVNNLRSNNSQNGVGAILDNSESVAPQAVTINGYADFWRNDLGGLRVLSKGAILVNKLNADDQWGGGISDYGALLDNTYGSGASVTINGYARTHNNDGYGLIIASDGMITVNSLEASDNNDFGAYLNNTTGTAGVSLLGPGANFGNNGGYGLQVLSNGLINVNSPDGLDAWGNGDFGALLDNSGGTAGVTIGALGNGNYIGDNYGNGLEIRTKGAVTLGNLTANNNGHYDTAGLEGDPDTYYGFGALIDNSGGIANVTLTGNNTFRDNWTDGLVVYSKGIITTNNLESGGNGRWDGYWDEGTSSYMGNDADGPDTVYGTGVTLDNCLYDTNPLAPNTCVGDKKAVNVNGLNSFDNSWSGNLYISSDGAVKANNISSNGGGTGVFIVNDYDELAPQSVTFTGSNSFSNSWFNGLEIYSNGLVSLNNVDASWNGQSGDHGFGVVIDNSGVTTPADVKFTGENYFTGNWNDGLNILTEGSIALNSVATYWNGRDGGTGAGVYLDNSGALATKTITLTGLNLFYGNDGDGLYINAAGNVTLNNVTADQNSAIGVSIDAVGNVLISCGSITRNSLGWVIEIGATKTLTLNGVFAYGNVANTEYLGTLPIISKLTCP